MTNTIRFIHISDTHIGVDEDSEVLGVAPLPFAEKLVNHLVKLPFKPDFIVHTGDVVHEMKHVENDKAYERAETLFNKIKTPIYYVTGNHDTTPPIKKLLTMGPKKDLSDSLNTYRFDVGRTRFMTIDARGPDKIDPHGMISDEQMQIVEDEVKNGTKPLVIFIHYPAIELDSVWMNRDALILNGDKLHSLFVQAKDRIRGVFFGHVHRSMSVVRDGILYSSAGSPFIQFYAWPEQPKPEFQTDRTIFYNLVTINTHGVIVKTQTVV